VDAEELVSVVCPRIGDLGWAFYFIPETLKVGKSLGLDGLRFYFLGRGGVLGDVDAGVVVSAFGYFAPSLVYKMWNSAREICPPQDAAHAYMNCCADLGRSHLIGVPDLAGFCDAAGAVNDAADPVGLALYAGIRTQPLAEDLAGRAMQLITVLRELRGSAHLLAVRAKGLDARTAHYLHRPEDMAMFGWGEDDTPDVTDFERRKLQAALYLTDEIVLPAYSVLDQRGQKTLTAGLEAIGDALSRLPQR
jgi:hypothetical protein